MSERIGTIGMLLGLDPETASDHRVDPADLLELGRKIAAALRGALPMQHLPRASRETVAALAGTLGMPVVGCLTTAWNKRAELRKFADPAQYPPDRVASLVLSPHSVKWVYRPSVEVLLDGRSVAKLPFVVEVEFKLDGAELVVQAGRMRRIKTGRSTITAKLTFHGAMLHTRTLDERTLPGELSLGDGVPIPGAPAPAVRAGPSPVPTAPGDATAERR